MKKVITFIICGIFSLQLVSAQKLSKSVESALDNIAGGYVMYGVEQLNKAARMNDVVAQFYIAQCYHYGIGMNCSDADAFKWYRRTAERGLPDGMAKLAECYAAGRGTTASQGRASEWNERYKKKGGHCSLPDILEYYRLAQMHPDYFAQTPGGNIVSDGANRSNSVNDAQNSLLSVNSIPSRNSNNTVLSADLNQRISMQGLNADDNQKTIKSDVDVDIPQTSIVQQNTFALIIANENYQEVERVANAINDGEVFAEYCRKTLGMPEENVHLVKDATMNNIRRKLNQFRDISNAYKGDVNIIFYYAGHGLPDESTRASYILPIDGFNADLATCISIDDIYSRLAEFGANKTVVFMDACFSGSLRGEGMLASARGIAIKPKVAEPRGNIIVLSACQGDETAYPYAEKGHGLMSYFLMKKLKESAGNVPLGELVDYVIDNVSKTAIVKNGKPQTPTVSVASSLSDKWRDLRLSF